MSKTIARYGRVDLLCIDELGYMELDRGGAELLFQVLTEREKKYSVAIASNEFFSGRTKTSTDPRLCAAIVDRFTFNGAIYLEGVLAATCERVELYRAFADFAPDEMTARLHPVLALQARTLFQLGRDKEADVVVQWLRAHPLPDVEDDGGGDGTA